MTQTTSSTASPGVSEIDTSSRCALSFLIVASLLWLVTGGVLALLNLLQTHTPGFLADCFLFTHGRLDAMQETALVYGWAGNAGIAVALWLLSRLAGSALRGTNYLVAGALFWNIGVKLGVYGIAFGDMTSFSLMQMPDYVQPLMLVAYALMAAPGVLAWTGRRNDSTFATQWYAIAALFLFPWFFSAAQVMLLFAPVRGTLQSVVSTWYAQNLFSLWMAPLAIAALYYLVPKIRGKVMPNYDFAIYGFWSLIIFGTWTGGRHLIGGPVPAWIPSVALGAGVLVLFHHMIVYLNMSSIGGSGGVVMKLAKYGFYAYLLSGVIDALFSLRSFAVITQFTLFQEAQWQLALASFSLIMFGAIYYLVPRISGAVWPSSGLVRGHYLATILGYAVLIISLGIAGWQQGTALNDASMSFEAIAAQYRPWLLVASAAQALLLVGNLALLVNFVRILFVKTSEAATGQFRQPTNLEASSS